MKFPEEFRASFKGWESYRGDQFGWFIAMGPCGRRLAMLADDGQISGWEHVSVSLEDKRKIPNWQEMSFVKSLFWEDEECVVQFHPPKSDYVNNCNGCLHLWRSKLQEFPMPDKILV